MITSSSLPNWRSSAGHVISTHQAVHHEQALMGPVAPRHPLCSTMCTVFACPAARITRKLQALLSLIRPAAALENAKSLIKWADRASGAVAVSDPKCEVRLQPSRE